MTLRKKGMRRRLRDRKPGDLVHVGICRGCGVVLKVKKQETKNGVINCPVCGERRELGRG